MYLEFKYHSYKSVAHQLLLTKKAKEQIIVKFVRCDKSNEIYKQRSKLNGTNTTCLPPVAVELGESIAKRPKKIYIIKSLTAYRRPLFRKIDIFKDSNK